MLQDTYGFPVQYQRMHMRVHPQVQATQHVSKFVCDEDEPGGLLIVYYAGHGWAEDNSVGHLSLSGRFPETPAEQDMSIEWVEVERTLGKTKSDVLVIFDCCHAGSLCRPATRGRRRSFHYVAACKENQRTFSWGDKSFTTAMIWALKEMANSPGFTVTQLVSKLMEYKSFPRDQQEAVIYPSRFGPSEREIWIAPARAQDAADLTKDIPAGTRREDGKPTADVLDLRLHFETRATPAHIESTAMALKDFLETNPALHFHRMSFVDHTSFIEGPAKRWLKMVREKPSAKKGTTPIGQHATAVNSAADAESFQNLLLQLPSIKTKDDMPGSVISTTAVATPASPWGRETLGVRPDTSGNGVVYHLSMAVRLVFRNWQPTPVWHSPAFLVAALEN